jgi:hypothetical protein
MLPEPQQSKLECLTTAVRNATQVDWSKGNSIIGFNIWGIQIHKSRYHIISLHWHHESNHKSINGTELCRKANICEIMKIWSSNYYHMIQQNSKLRLHKSPKVSNLSWRIQQICIGYMVHFFCINSGHITRDPCPFRPLPGSAHPDHRRYSPDTAPRRLLSAGTSDRTLK